jgi:hypothetical protein
MPADRKSNDYHFVTRWEIPGTCEAVSEVLGNPLDLPRWWPSVYLKVEQLRPPDARGLEANGDFDGRGVWTFAQHAQPCQGEICLKRELSRRP